MYKDSEDLKRILDWDRICQRNPNISRGLWIWTKFVSKNRRFGEDAAFGNDLQEECEDFERILDLGRIRKRITLIWRGLAKG